ncbi:hypothetical protein D3C79_954910 [compost metagenome]
MDSGDWSKDTISEQEIMNLLQEKIKSVSVEQIKDDIVRFIPDPSVVAIWSTQYFMDLTRLIRFK